MTLLSRLWLALASLTRVGRPTQLSAVDERAAGALALLSLLEREGRLIDFVMEPIDDDYDDAAVGQAARGIQLGLRRALRTCVTLERVRSEPEGTRLTIPAGFSPHELRLTGNVEGEPPFTGRLAHAGWRVTRIELPAAAANPYVLAPCEVEL